MSSTNSSKTDEKKELSDQEQRILKMYGKVPNRKDLLNHKLKRVKDRKYFDSGDYAMSKAGKSTVVGSLHPSPDSIPHSHPTQNTSSPSKESSLSKDSTTDNSKTEQ
ncbi:hypothetical protein O9G_000980 [Rozella allomycis CSF55]|uniref:mRNA stability protein n=1 Tax=Rozella allomycis (strain CSF55) TaxID=988480 RepID=A0A075ANC1_ROZAC|nr:hypothetical protein O9G_000980 [Rozella allomycis CSF55]|eukprot:EPZ31335.1 hypothetical protein O9G_000980 [Rozella allomycis CSF55]